MESTSDSARGGQFSGSRSTVTSSTRTGARPQGSTTEESRGGLFPGRSNQSTAPTSGQIVTGESGAASQGGLFVGGNTSRTPIVEGPSLENTGTTTALSRGGLFPGRNTNAPVIEGPRGPAGETGPQGPEGPVGPRGNTGQDGVGITGIIDNGDGTLTINFGNGGQIITENLTGPTGPAGMDIQVGQVSGVFNEVDRDLTITVDGVDSQPIRIPGGGGTPGPTVTTHRVVITFISPTATSTAGVDVGTNPSTVTLTGFTDITNNIEVTLNGIALIGGTDFAVANNVLTMMQSYVWDTGDVVIIEFTT